MGGCGWLAAAVLRSGVELSLLIRLGGWVVGILESNAKLNSKLRLKLKLKIELRFGIKLFMRSLLIRNS